MRTIRVNLGDRSYPIYLGEGLLARAGELLKEAGCGAKVAVVTNPTVAGLYLKPLQEALTGAGFQVTSILLPDGEGHKNLKSVAAIYDQMIRARFDRGSCVAALGGGVIGDLAGFAAATFLRGIPYVQLPTTLLAQVDSSIGGKTGVNHRAGKNLIGAFYQPRAVVMDLAALRTLPRRELLAGLAEVVKYGIIQEPALFSLLEEKLEKIVALDPELLQEAVGVSCAVKARVVEKDEREEDYRSVLNFGHTVGHALEAVTGYDKLLHGEAVAIGMAQAAAISVAQGLCDEESRRRIELLLRRAELPTAIPAPIQARDLVKKMEVDKKSAGGKIKFVLCEGIGKTRFCWFSPEEIAARLSAPVER